MLHDTSQLPRSATLALWLGELTATATAGESPSSAAPPSPKTSFTTSSSRLAVIESAVRGDDEPHDVEDIDGVLIGTDLEGVASALGGIGLADLLHSWHGRIEAASAIFPTSGAIAGLPLGKAQSGDSSVRDLARLTNPGFDDEFPTEDATFRDVALDAEESVLVTVGGRRLALVPVAEEFGSAFEPGYRVTWQLFEIEPWERALLGVVGDIAEADREMRQALVEATEVLSRLDVAKWRPDQADDLARLRRRRLTEETLPSGLDPRRVRMAQTAIQLLTIVELAGGDDGGAVTSWEAGQRMGALRNISAVARRALTAATFTVPGNA